jgi:uncharacterized protein YjbI with pentapeptide repeats
MRIYFKTKNNHMNRISLSKSLAYSIFIWLSIDTVSGQVTQKIGGNPGTIDPKAVLELESTTKGFLLPRMTSAQMAAITNPTSGMIIFCTDCGVASDGELRISYNGVWQTYKGNVTGNITGTAANVTGTVAVLNGGTGATTATGALTNLGAAPIASPTFTGTVTAPIYASTPQALTDGATISWNPTNGLNASVTLGGNRTLSFASLPAVGSYGTLIVTQDATGNRTITLPTTANKVLGSASTTTIALSTAANAKDILNFYYDGTNCYWNIGQGYGTAAPAVITNLATGVSGTLPVANGGSGAATLTGYVKGNGTSAMTANASIPVADVTGAAPIASPTFTGTPAAPTAAAGTNTTQVATTEFVTGAIATATIPDATTSAKGKIQLAGDLSGTAALPVVAANAITTSKILDANVTTAKIADANVTTVKIADANITTAKILDANVTTAKIADANVTDAKIATVSGSKVTGNISGSAANVTGTVAVANGGTGATTATGALTNLGAAPIASPTFTGTVTAPIYASTPQALTDGATISWNPTNGLNASVTLGGNRTLSFASLPAVGSYGTLIVTQDATGNRTITLPTTANKVLGSASTTTIALSTAANAKDILNFYYDGTNCYWNIGQGYGTAAPAVITNLATGVSGTLPVANGGSGAATLTGYVKGNGTSAMTANASIPVADVTGAAPIASPTFTGTPAAPTAAAGTNTTQVATTEFVTGAIATATIPDATTSAKGKIQLAGDLSGTAALPVVAANAITTSKILDANVTTAKIADANVTTVKIADANITTAKILDANVTTAKIADANVTDAKIATVSGSKVTGNISGSAANVTGTVAVANGGTGATTATGALTNLGAAPIASPTFTGTVTAPIYASTPQALTDGATISWNPTNGLNASVTLGGNRTLSFASLPAVGSYGTLIVTQDATGNRTITLPTTANKVLGSASTTTIALSTAANAKDILNFYYDGTNCYWNIGQGYGTAAPAVITNLATGVSGTLPVANGGSGAATLTGYVKGNGTSAMTANASIPVADVTGAAPIASPTFTGTPAAPTAAAGTNTTQVATTEFVTGAIATATIPDATTSAKGKIQLAGDLSGTAALPVVAANAITTSKILDANVTTAKIADANVTTVKIADANITTAKILDANVTTAKIADANVTDAKIATVSGSKVTGNISGSAANVTGTVAVANGGTGATTATGALTNLGAAPIASPTFTGTVTAPIYASTPQALTDGATISWNPTNGLNASVTLGGNRTLSFASLPAVGSYGTLIVTQDATGNRTITLPTTANKVLGSASTTTIALSTAANAKDILNFYYDGTNCYWNIGQGYGTAAPAVITNLATGVSGTLPVANGGSGAATLTGYVKGNGTSAMTANASIPVADVTGAAPIASPTFTGTPAAPTAAAGTNTTQVATTEFVTGAIATATIPDATTSAKGKIQLAGDLSGTAALPVVAANAITTSKILDANVTTAKIADANVTTVKIADANITTAKILDANVTTAKIADANVTDAKIATVSGSKVTGNISGSAANVTGTVAVANGGTGQTTIAGVQAVLGLAGTTVAIGASSGSTNQGAGAIGVGNGTGQTNQGSQSIAIGYVAGSSNQGANSVAIGPNAAQSGQGAQSIAIGYAANSAADKATALGGFSTAAHTNATALGYQAATTGNNTIQLGADGVTIPGSTAITNVKTSGTLTAGSVTYPNTHGTANQVLSTTGSGTLAWVTPTTTATAYSGTLPISNGGTGLTSVPANGQIDIGNGTGFTRATLTAGSGITITNNAGAITITAAVRPTTDQTIVSSAAQTSFTLSETPVNAKVWMFINGVRTNNLAYSVSGTTVTYAPSGNNSYVISVGDRIQFDYCY